MFMAQLAFVLPLLLQAATQPVTQPASTAVAPPAKPADKLICRRELRSGSLADYKKICHTRAEWQRMSDNERDTWQELQGTKGSTHGG
jgi:hypothetical protein